MLKDDGPPNEPLRTKAERKWRNNEIRKRIVEERQKPKAKESDEEPEPADVIINEGRVDGPVKRFERQFLKDIRAMMETHTKRNLEIYAAMIERRRYKLLKEKLKRLQAAQQSHGG
jgi:hypothetical protein